MKKQNKNKKLPKSYNFTYVINKKEVILNILRKADRPLSPKEILALSGLNYNTIKVYLRQLLASGRVKQPYRGAYLVTKITHGVIVEGVLPRVHNLVLSVPWLRPKYGIGPYLIEVGFVRIRVVPGAQRRRITGFISCDKGLDYNGFCLAVELFRSKLREFGVDPPLEAIRVKTVELSEDYRSLRLDGLKCLTLRDLRGGLERIYNIPEGLRSEVRFENRSMHEIYALLKGGITSYNLLQGQFMIIRKLDEFMEALKRNNELVFQALRLMKALLEKKGG